MTENGDDKGAPIERTAALVPASERGVQVNTLEGMVRFAKYAIDSGLVPMGVDTPSKAVVIMQTGMEAGLPIMASFRFLYVVQGQPAWRGDGAKALIRAKGLLRPGTDFKAWVENEPAPGTKWQDWPDNVTACIQTWRDGTSEPVTHRYSVGDAKIQELWGKKTKSGKPTSWITRPSRMLMYRALGEHCRDQYSDALGGFGIAEEVRDYGPPKTTPPTHEEAPKGRDPIIVEVTKIEGAGSEPEGMTHLSPTGTEGVSADPAPVCPECEQPVGSCKPECSLQGETPPEPEKKEGSLL
jgi:hypothetical protein